MDQLKSNEWATIYGYEDTVATLADGTELPVRVRQIRVRQVPHLMGILEDEFAVLDYVCVGIENPLPEGWVDLLSPKSHRELVAKARSLNFPVILDTLESQVQVAEDLFRTSPVIDRAKALQRSLTSAPSSSAEATTKS